MHYSLTYEVPAETRLEALLVVSRMLRTGVIVTELVHAKPTYVGWYEVKMDVRENEPEQADPITAAKAEADRA